VKQHRRLWGLALWLGCQTPAWSHPHSWIDMVSRPQIDAQGQLTAFQLSWLFDEFYTATLLDDAKGQPNQAFLADLAKQSLATLQEGHYLLHFRGVKPAPGFGPVSDFRYSLFKGQLKLDFTLPLATSVDLTGQTLDYAIYDSTYYIDMSHHAPEAIQLEGPGASHCKAIYQAPNPSDKDIEYASSLDINQQGDEGLGEVFAEWISLHCQGDTTP